MHNRSVTGVHPATAEGMRGGVRIVVVPLHHNISAHDNFAERLTVVRNLISVVIYNSQIAGCDQFHALARFDYGTFTQGQSRMFRKRFTDSDKRRRLRHSVNLRDIPSE